VSFSLNQCLAILTADNKEKKPIKISGAASHNPAWNQIKADIFQTPVVTMNCKESSCLGAAIIAAVGAGIYSDFTEAAKTMTAIRDEYIPQKALSSYYSDMMAVYTSLYPVLQKQFKKLSLVRWEK
jgi:xylulokinase